MFRALHVLIVEVYGLIAFNLRFKKSAPRV